VDPVFGEQDFRGHWYFYISVLIFNLHCGPSSLSFALFYCCLPRPL
jgi:hypothetical protein